MRRLFFPPDFPGSFKRGLILSFSLSTLDEKIAAIIEPGAPAPSKRLDTLKDMKAAGFLAGVNAIPLLPFISDTEEELEKMIAVSKQSGADFLLAGGLTLFGDNPGDSRFLYYRFLSGNYPALTGQYEAMFGNNYYQPWRYQEDLKKKIDRLCKRYDLKTSIL